MRYCSGDEGSWICVNLSEDTSVMLEEVVARTARHCKVNWSGAVGVSGAYTCTGCNQILSCGCIPLVCRFMEWSATILREKVLYERISHQNSHAMRSLIGIQYEYFGTTVDREKDNLAPCTCSFRRFPSCSLAQGRLMS